MILQCVISATNDTDSVRRAALTVLAVSWLVTRSPSNDTRIDQRRQVAVTWRQDCAVDLQISHTSIRTLDTRVYIHHWQTDVLTCDKCDKQFTCEQLVVSTGIVIPWSGHRTAAVVAQTRFQYERYYEYLLFPHFPWTKSSSIQLPRDVDLGLASWLSLRTKLWSLVLALALRVKSLLTSL